MKVGYKVHIPTSYDLEDKKVQDYVSRMTNWQRNQWAKAKYPKNKTQLMYYLMLTRRLRNENKEKERLARYS